MIHRYAVFIAAIAIPLAAGGCGSSAADENTHEPAKVAISSGDTDDSVIQTHPDDLSEAYKQNPEAAARKYGAHVVSVSGNVVRVVRMAGFTDATLARANRAGTVEVSLPPEEPDAFRLQKGQTIAVSCGQIDVFETPIMLRQCDGLMILDTD